MNLNQDLSTQKNNDMLLDNVWTLFNHLPDSNRPDIVNAAYFFCTFYGFDPDCLPYMLFDAVNKKMIQDAKESSEDIEEKDSQFEFKELNFS